MLGFPEKIGLICGDQFYEGGQLGFQAVFIKEVMEVLPGFGEPQRSQTRAQT
jgi:hypothetical protein